MYNEVIATQARQLREALHAVLWCPGAARMSVRIDEALAAWEQTEVERPLTIVLLGGTGVGKSQLYNALIEQEASPVSSSVRACTERLHIAAWPADRGAFGIFGEDECELHDGVAAGVALVDTPDIDSVEKRHVELTRRILAMADIVVYVSSPDKRASFDIVREVQEWAARARWFFVMNKIDTGSAHADGVRADFERRLREIGFQPDASVVFSVSATHAEEYEFERLRAALFSRRTARQIAAVQDDVRLGRILYATSGDVVEEMQQMRETLLATERRYVERVQRIYAGELQRTEAVRAVKRAVHEATWREISGHTWWVMNIALWARQRLGYIGAGWMFARMVTGGYSVTRLVRGVWYAVRAMVSGRVPLQRVVEGFSAPALWDLQQVEEDVRAQLAEYGCDVQESGEAARVCEAESGRGGVAERVAREVMQEWGANRGNLREDLQRVEDALQHTVEQEAERRAATISRPWRVAFANALPVVIVGQVMWRVGNAWIAAAWLPWEFYAMALLMTGASLVPGYWLIAAGVWRVNKELSTDVRGVLREPYETRHIRAVLRLMDEIMRLLHNMQKNALAVRDALARDVARGNCGATVQRDDIGKDTL